MAAAARPPGSAEARVPCPLCGGLIHPIAGRCKHCKADLGGLRDVRPAAAAALPALGHASSASVRPAATTPVPAPVAATSPAAPVAVAQAMPALRGDASPILPQRPTGRMPATSAGLSWKSWPVIVIVLAGLAIVAAVVLMVWPPGGASSEAGTTRKLQAPPAPQRMDTDPLPEVSKPPSGGSTSGVDPWKSPTDPTPTPTPAPAPRQPSADPSPDDVYGDLLKSFPNLPDSPQLPDLPDPDRDPLAQRRPPAGSFMLVAIRRACTRLSRCSSDNDLLETLCETAALWPTTPVPSCAAAQRCLEHLDALPCDSNGYSSTTALFGLISQLRDCSDALSC
ncbi:MAG: hypothetical protein ACTHU0_16060 [Kofleriaceae bacterium]